MNTKCGQRFTPDDRSCETFTKVLGADKDKVRRNHTLGNNNKDAMFDCPGGGGGYLGQFLLGLCRWPFRTPTPLPHYSLFCDQL